MSKSRVIVALDGIDETRAIELAREMAGHAWGFKVNDQLISSDVGLITRLKEFGSVFADPKCHDIPNTVGNAVRILSSAGADLITVHASGGRAMLEQAVKNAGSAKILSVTILTSMTEADSMQIYQRPIKDAVVNFAKLASEVGVHGMVCSALELEYFTGDTHPSPGIKVTPGIRPSWYGKADDQTRVVGPKEAFQLGASYVVIGRPITESDNPRETLQRINAEIGDS